MLFRSGYNVTADYTGKVSRIALDRVRYVAIFERTTYVPDEPELLGELDIPTDPVIEPVRNPSSYHMNWAYILVPLGVIATAGGGIGLALFLKRRSETGEEDSE